MFLRILEINRENCVGTMGAIEEKNNRAKQGIILTGLWHANSPHTPSVQTQWQTITMTVTMHTTWLSCVAFHPLCTLSLLWNVLIAPLNYPDPDLWWLLSNAIGFWLLSSLVHTQPAMWCNAALYNIHTYIGHLVTWQPSLSLPPHCLCCDDGYMANASSSVMCFYYCQTLVPAIESTTSDNGPSETGTTSLQRTLVSTPC